MPSLATPLALVLAACLALLGLQQYRLKAAEVTHLEQQRDTAQGRADSLSEQLQSATDNARERDAAQAKLRDQLADVRSLLGKRNQLIERLESENQELRDWAATALPAAAISLRQRPEIIGAAGYRAWLSARDSLPPTAEQPHDQRPTAAQPR